MNEPVSWRIAQTLELLAPAWTADDPQKNFAVQVCTVRDRAASLSRIPETEQIAALLHWIQTAFDRWLQDTPDWARLSALCLQAAAAAGVESARSVAALQTDLLLILVEILEPVTVLCMATGLVQVRRALLAELATYNPGGDRRVATLISRGQVLREAYHEHGVTADLEQAQELLEEAVSSSATADLHARALNGLAYVLRDHYVSTGDPTVLSRAFTLLDQALTLAVPAPIRAESLTSKGMLYYLRYMDEGQPGDLDACLPLHEEALRLLPRGLHRPRYLNYLGIALDYRYLLEGDPADLQRRVEVQEEAYALAPGGPTRRIYASNLGNVLLHQFLLHGNPADLDRRIQLQTEAVSLAGQGPQRPQCLNNLGNAYGDRYALHGRPEDLEQAIVLTEEAVLLTPAGPYRPMFLSNCGTHRWSRYLRHAAREDLEQAVQVLEEAVDLTAGGPERPGRLLALARALVTRSAVSADAADLDRAATLLQEAIERTPGGPYRPDMLQVLSQIAAQQAALTGDPAYVRRQADLLREALRGAGVWQIPDLARTLALAEAHLAGQEGELSGARWLESAVQACETGLEALERMLAVGSETVEAALLGQYGDLYDQQVTYTLRLAEISARTGGGTGDRRWLRAAYTAAERGKGRRAAALLASRAARPGPESAAQLAAIEQVREELARVDRQLAGIVPYHPGMAAMNDWLAEAAQEGAAAPAMAAESLASDPESPLHALLVSREEELWARMEALLQDLATSDRDYAELRGFAPPLPPERIAGALPSGGALVLFYPLPDTLACFVLRHPAAAERDRTITACRIPLGRAVLARVVGQIFPEHQPDRLPRTAVLDASLLHLARLLYPALSPLLPPADATHPASLVLVPTGALHRLPLHALPWPAPELGGRLLDQYVISYAGSADVLPLAQQKHAARTGLVALAPGLPLVQGAPFPDGTLLEAATLTRLSEGQALLRKQANLAALLEARIAANRRWALFATHGRAGRSEAGRSGLLFYDTQGTGGIWLSAAEILQLLDLEGVDHLALGACSTHADDPAPGDRLAGLLRALLYRGARSVQATLWPVRDDATTLLGLWTWEQLLAGERDKAAALRAATRRLQRCSGEEAAAAWLRCATNLPEHDPARQQAAHGAEALRSQQAPFSRTVDWAPFVLHGAPLVHADPER